MRVVPLSEAVAVNPKLDRAHLVDETQVSFVPMAAVGAADGSMDASTVRPYAQVKKGYTHFRENDVLFAKVTPCMENGKMAVARKLMNGMGFGSTEFHVLRPRDGVDPHYVYHFVSSQTFRREAARHMTGAVGLRRVPSAFLESAEIPLPALEEQREIVAELEKQFSRLDEAVANLQRVKANLKRYKASVLKAAVEGRLVETEATLAHREGRPYETGEQLLQRILNERRAKWAGKGKYNEPATADAAGLGVLPQGWGIASLDMISTHSGYGTSQKCGYENDGPPVLRIPNVQHGVLELHDLKFAPNEFNFADSEAVRSGDMLIIRTNGSKSLIGRAAVVMSEPKRKMSFASYLIRFRLASMACIPAWTSLVWQTSQMRQWIEAHAATSAGQHNVSMTVLAKAVIPVPAPTEQVRIVAEVDRHLSILRGVEAEVDANLQRAQALRQSVLQRAFSGKLLAGKNQLTLPYRAGSVEPVSVVIASLLIAANHDQPTFGRVKLQKLLHLAIHHAQVEAANEEFERRQAGPLDMRMLLGVIKRVDDLGWFRETARAGKLPDEKIYSYAALTKADEYRQHLDVLKTEQLSAIRDLNKLMRNWSVPDCELFSTVYAAWNDLILWKHEPTVAAITKQVRDCWTESKKKFSPETIAETVEKIKRLGYEPKGFGRPTLGQAADTLSGSLF